MLKKLIQQAEKVNKLDIDKLEKVPTGLKSLKNKACKLHVDKLVPVPVDLSKLREEVKIMLLKIMIMMSKLKTNTLVVILVIYKTKLMKLKKKITYHDQSNKYITAREFIKLKSQRFATKLAQANSASKIDIAPLVKKTYFDGKLEILKKKVTSNKRKHIEA